MLIQLEQARLAAMNSGNYHLAKEYFKKIVEIQPNYEHGISFYNLACCYHDMGNMAQAKINYKKALSYQPEEVIFLVDMVLFYIQWVIIKMLF